MKLYFGLAGFAAGTLGFIAYQAAHHPRPNVVPEPRAPVHATAPTATGPTYVIMPATGTATAVAATPPPPKKKHHRRKDPSADESSDAAEPIAGTKPKPPVLRLSTATSGVAEPADPKPAAPPSTSPSEPTMDALLNDNTPSLSGRKPK